MITEECKHQLWKYKVKKKVKVGSWDLEGRVKAKFGVLKSPFTQTETKVS